MATVREMLTRFRFAEATSRECRDEERRKGALKQMWYIEASRRTRLTGDDDVTYSPLHVASRAIISALDTSMAGLRRRLHGHTNNSSSTSEPHTLHCACAPETKPTTKENGAGKTLSFYPSYQSANESTTSISSDINYSDCGSGALRQTGAAKYSLADAKKLLGSFRHNR